MDIRDLIEPDRVLSNVEARSKKHALEILSELLAKTGQDLTNAEVFDSLISRERLGCTALGKGVAIPHGRLRNIPGNIGAFLKLSVPVPFDAPDGEPVDLIFGLLVPEDCGNDHLDDLAEITKMFSEIDLRETLRQASSSSTSYDLLLDAHQAPGTSSSTLSP